MKLEFISIRIASKGYTVYKMSPMTATRMAVVGSRNIFAGVRVWFLRRRFMKRGTFNELFDCYQKILLMIPLEDIASVAAVMEGLSATISKDHE